MIIFTATIIRISEKGLPKAPADSRWESKVKLSLYTSMAVMVVTGNEARSSVPGQQRKSGSAPQSGGRV